MTPEMKAYVALLKLPINSMGSVRLKPEIQSAMACLRDSIAERCADPEFSHSEVVQNIFEAIAREET